MFQSPMRASHGSKAPVDGLLQLIFEATQIQLSTRAVDGFAVLDHA
jgi:hypothetical protein